MSQQDEPRFPALSRARTGGALDEASSPSRSAGTSPKQTLRAPGSFNERAPPPWLIRAEKSKADDDDDACSNADSVLSDYRDASGSEQMDAATTQSPASHVVSSSSEASQDTKKVSRINSAKKDKEKELPAVAGAAESRRPASGSSTSDPRRSPTSTSPSKTGASKVDQELPVSASTAGEWVNRLQALREVADEHSSCARRMFSHVEEMFPEARAFPSSTKSKILEEIFLQLELSRDLLERHAQGLIGTDLAELRMIKAESKRLDDKITRMNKLYLKEVKSLRELLLKKEAAGRVAPLKASYEPLMFMEPAQRGCLLALLEQKLEAILEANPEVQRGANQAELSRLQDLFKKEQQSSLERQVAKLTEEEQAARKQIAVLEAYNDKLKKKIQKIDDGGSMSFMERQASDASGSIGAKDLPVLAPAGKPKSGRPKRGATFTRAASGQVGQAQAMDP